MFVKGCLLRDTGYGMFVTGCLLRACDSFLDLSFDKNNNDNNKKENRIKTKTKKEIKILTKQK